MSEQKNEKIKSEDINNKDSAERVNPSILAKEWIEVLRLSVILFQSYAKNHAQKGIQLPSDEIGMMYTFQKFSENLLRHPADMLAEQLKIWWDYYELWNNTFMGIMGFPQKSTNPAFDEKDKRFKSPSWQESFVFNYIKQSYQIIAYRIMRIIAKSRGLSENEQRKVLFFSRLYINAISPSNFVLTNPDVLRETINTCGKNLIRGLQNLLEDLNNSSGTIQTKMSDEKAFSLGENIATTPGKVVFQNRIMQIIQYTASTEKVYKEPLLIIPPWINKFYILDLQAKNSFIKYCVDSGQTVFIISWVNPDENLCELSFEDYLKEGTLTAVDVVCDITKEKKINSIGYCIGGTLQAAMLSIMESKKDTRIASATFFTSLIDFSIAGDLSVFIDENQLSNIENKMKQKGYLDSSDMSTTFSILRDNELIWSFVINNYLLGREPMAFDLLYWNSDSTRMPAKMHAFYLRKMYLENKFKDPKGVNILGTDINISKIKIPVCFISTIEDHIAPWEGTYLGAKLFAGKTNFILGGSGHIAGIINPANSGKYFYLKNDVVKLPDKSQDWLKDAQRYEGSWWNEWKNWIINNSSGEIAKRKIGEGKYKALEDAPGSYVKVRVHPKR